MRRVHHSIPCRPKGNRPIGLYQVRGLIVDRTATIGMGSMFSIVNAPCHLARGIPKAHRRIRSILRKRDALRGIPLKRARTRTNRAAAKCRNVMAQSLSPIPQPAHVRHLRDIFSRPIVFTRCTGTRARHTFRDDGKICKHSTTRYG